MERALLLQQFGRLRSTHLSRSKLNSKIKACNRNITKRILKFNALFPDSPITEEMVKAAKSDWWALAENGGAWSDVLNSYNTAVSSTQLSPATVSDPQLHLTKLTCRKLFYALHGVRAAIEEEAIIRVEVKHAIDYFDKIIGLVEGKLSQLRSANANDESRSVLTRNLCFWEGRRNSIVDKFNGGDTPPVPQGWQGGGLGRGTGHGGVSVGARVGSDGRGSARVSLGSSNNLTTPSNLNPPLRSPVPVSVPRGGGLRLVTEDEAETLMNVRSIHADQPWFIEDQRQRNIEHKELQALLATCDDE